MPTLIYAFSNHWGTNISRRTLSELQKIIPDESITFLPVFFFPQNFFEKHIKSFCSPSCQRGGQGEIGQSGDLIIGLGDGLRNLSKIKIETQAKNAYNDKEIYPFSPILLDLNMPPVDNYDSNYFQIGTNMGTYNCNWIAYRTQLHINQKNLGTQHLFLHLPPKANATLVASKIHDLLKDNDLLSCYPRHISPLD